MAFWLLAVGGGGGEDEGVEEENGRVEARAGRVVREHDRVQDCSARRRVGGREAIACGGEVQWLRLGTVIDRSCEMGC